MQYIIIIIAVAFIFLVLKSKNKIESATTPETPDTPKEEGKWDLSMYFLKGSILTETEQRFYKLIAELIPQEYIIAPKVGMKDFIEIKSRENYMKHFGHISQKHIDFLVCRRDNLSPVLGIELDDATHKQTKRAERDKMVDEIYNQINLKVLHIPTNIRKEAIENALNSIFKPATE